MKKIIERIQESSNIPPELLKEKPPFPKRAKIEITTRCDFNCFFCSHTYKHIEKGDIDKDFLYRILDELMILGVKEIGLFWLGESLLVKELPEYVEYAKHIGIDYVFITTNGRLATPERIQELYKSGIDSIKFSINAGERENFKKTCGVDAFDQIIDNVKHAFAYRGGKKKPALYASTVFDPIKRNDYDLVHQLIGSCVDQHYPLRLYGRYTFANDDKERHKRIYTHANDGRALLSMLPCWSLFTEPHISYDGFLSACYCDHDEKFYVADLNVSSLTEAWNSEKFVNLRRHHLQKDVKGCVCENCIAYL
jgi:MoaA/NifB/PqqE/SkfB family radical SAM enzyme